MTENEKPFGFIGLGAMGQPLVRTLARNGFAVVVFDIDANAVALATQPPGVTAAASPREVAERCDRVFSCLPQLEAVEAVYLGADGVIAGARPGLITCDHSSVLPPLARKVADALAAKGVKHLDCPVLGGPPNCEAGNLTAVISGDEAAYRAVLPELEAISSKHHYVGGSGTASAIKVLQNGLGLVQSSAMGEVLAICEAEGLDPGLFYNVVSGGGGMADTRVFGQRWQIMAKRDHSYTTALDVSIKDSRLIVEMARHHALETPVLQESMNTYQDAAKAGWGRKDGSMVARVMDLRRGLVKAEDY